MYFYIFIKMNIIKDNDNFINENIIKYDHIINNKLKLCLTMIILYNKKSDFYEFYKEIFFMLK
jgi:hypothetical protein